MTNNPDTVLLLGNYRPSLTLARTLRDRGLRVVVGTHGCDKSCNHSNAVSYIWDHSPLTSSPDNFIKELHRFVESNTGPVSIFPIAEEYVRLIAQHEKLFNAFPNIISMSADTVNNCLNKNYMMQLALKNGVPTAEYASTSEEIEFSSAIRKLGYPVIIRPKDSTRRLAGKKAVFLENEKSLAAITDDIKRERYDLLVQQKFTGARHNIYFAANSGKLIRCLHAVINRTDSIDDTGLAVKGITLRPEGELVEQTSRLLAALDYSGIGCAQFLVNPDNGRTSFLEINPRIAGNHALPEHAGLDLGNYLFDWASGNEPDQHPVMGKADIRYCWTSGDLMGIKVSFLRGEINAVTAAKWCLRAVIDGIRSDVHMVFCMSDPVPGIKALWNIVPRIARWRQPPEINGKSTICQESTGKLT